MKKIFFIALALGPVGADATAETMKFNVEGLKPFGATFDEEKKCHKLCSARVTQHAREVGAKGNVDWGHILANVYEDTHGKNDRYCGCKYIGGMPELQDISNK